MNYNNTYPHKYKGQNSVRYAKLPIATVFGIGIISGIILFIILGLLIDFLLFGTINPCKTAISYEDGSSVLVCGARE